MYTLREAWIKMHGREPIEHWDGKMYCNKTDAAITFRANKTQGFMAAYTFTLVKAGWLTILYNGQEFTLRPDDLYLYSPGLEVTILAASDDYQGIRLLPRYFAEHHDIAFYASRLNISVVYLSRIVRRVSGRTVIDHINQMLLMEAVFLLRTSNLSINQIAGQLHFADTPSFSKFFLRMKGMSPREFRYEQP